MEKHQTEFKEAIENTPIIPAIKDAESLEQCLKSDACVIFVLFGDICNIAEIVERIDQRRAKEAAQGGFVGHGDADPAAAVPHRVEDAGGGISQGAVEIK